MTPLLALIIPYLPILIGLLAFGCIFVLVSQYLSYREKKVFIQRRFAAQQQQGRKGKKEFWLKPLLSPLAPLNARLGSGSLRKKIQGSLSAAGSPLSLEEYFAFKEILLIFIPLILGVLIGWPRLLANPILILAAAAGGFIYPDFWLKSSAQKRRKAVLRALPNVIDLLILAVDAGLDFMIAVRKVVERSRPGPMVYELSILHNEVQMGRVRREALKNLAQRLDLPEVHSFARTLIQAERMGTPMGEALRALSEEIRIRQFQRGEQQALKAPIKMLFPLLFCILPVVLILVGAPVILQFFQSGVDFFK